MDDKVGVGLLRFRKRAGGGSLSASGTRRSRERNGFRSGDFEPVTNRNQRAITFRSIHGAGGGTYSGHDADAERNHGRRARNQCGGCRAGRGVGWQDVLGIGGECLGDANRHDDESGRARIHAEPGQRNHPGGVLQRQRRSDRRRGFGDGQYPGRSQRLRRDRHPGRGEYGQRNGDRREHADRQYRLREWLAGHGHDGDADALGGQRHGVGRLLCGDDSDGGGYGFGGGEHTGRRQSLRCDRQFGGGQHRERYGGGRRYTRR